MSTLPDSSSLDDVEFNILKDYYRFGSNPLQTGDA
jgi:hypothetical protein